MNPESGGMGKRWQRVRFAFLIRASTQGLFARDALQRMLLPGSYEARLRGEAREFRDVRCVETTVREGGSSLEARITRPEGNAWAWVLICHGIGERLYFWSKVQAMLADAGMGSLVFHYTSYGRSRGKASPERFEEDAAAAYAHMAGLAEGMPMFVFGTSMGTAVAVHVVGRLEPKPAGMVLSQGFTSLREASAAVLETARLRWSGLGQWMPDVWRSVEELRWVDVPVMVVHGPEDELFPVSMGEALHTAVVERTGGTQAMHAPAGFAHGDVSLRPEVGYWGPVLEFMKELAG